MSERASGDSLLVIRLGAMGDIIHALPAVASLKMSFPAQRIKWLVAQRWTPLLEGNPFVDEVLPFERAGARSVWQLRRNLGPMRPGLAVDFQGLLQSAWAGWSARPRKYFGFDRNVAREPLASLFYSQRVAITGPHRVQRNLQLVAAAGATEATHEAWIPPGQPEGLLPRAPFVLASPLAGWSSKQWPLALYEQLGGLLNKEGWELVVNIPEDRAAEWATARNVTVHRSGLPGLIHATRRASAVVGVDSGPVHLAAALKKPGVALYGPTDPAQTGPFESPMTVLRLPEAVTTYKRRRQVDASMSGLTVEQVRDALLRSLAREPKQVLSAARVR